MVGKERNYTIAAVSGFCTQIVGREAAKWADN